MGKMVSPDGSKAEKSPRKQHQSERGRVDWKGYLSPSLTQNEKELYKRWRAGTDNCSPALKSALDAGYKISVDFQAREGAYRAGLYCQAPHLKEAGYCLTTFAGDWWEAVNRVVFIHTELLGADWTPLITKSGWKDDWA